MLQTAASPHFLKRLAAVVGGVTLAAGDCGRMGARSLLRCEAPGAPCAACAGGVAGDPIGAQALAAWSGAVQALLDHVDTGTRATVALSWPEPASGPARVLALQDAPVHLARMLEAREPDEVAWLSAIDGQLELGPERHGTRRLIVRPTDPSLEAFAYELQVPAAARLRKAAGDAVAFAEPLTEGEPSPLNVLSLLGSLALLGWFTADLDRIFSAAGARLDESHVALVLRAMGSKARLRDPEGTLMDHFDLRAENDRLLAQGEEPDVADPVLLGLSALTD